MLFRTFVLVGAGAFFLYNAVAIQQRHEHNGILQPYDAAPPEIVLDQGDEQLLEKGGAVSKQLNIPQGKRGVIVIRVNAPAEVIWPVISDFDSYPEWIKSMQTTEIYRREDNHIFVKFVAKHWLAGRVTWYVDHDYPRGDRDWGTWKLDYSYRSDLDDSVGFWRVKPVTGQAEKSDVIYSADLRLKGWVPAFVESAIIKKELKAATQWVKEQSEAPG